MRNAFAFSFRLRNAYRANGIIWALKGIPLVRGLLPSSLYASRRLKAFANVVSGVLEIVNAFLGKAVYLYLVWSLALSMPVERADAFTHMLVFATIIGGFLNTKIFEPTKDKYYAMFLMRMNARTYTLTDYSVFMGKMVVGFLVFAFVFGRALGVSALTCAAIPLYVVCVKLCFTALSLADCRRHEKAMNENQFTPPVIVAALVLLALAIAPPYVGFVLPGWALPALAAALLIPSAFAARYIASFPAYRSVYQALLKPEYYMGGGKIRAGAAQQLAMQKKMSADVTQTSDRSGYAYFNDLFMKRHARLLTRSAKRITLGAALLFLAAAAVLRFIPAAHEAVNHLLMNDLPYALFVMYLINRGRAITQAMFMNCDHSMLAYRFYRQPKALLKLFVARLKSVILINLMPAGVIALGLPLLLYISGGTSQPLQYAVLFVSILAMSVFFSVHSMVLYYLLQPYNVNLESKSAAYGILNWITYMISYAAIQVKLPTLWFGAAISAFCILYAVAASILAYRLAPKTFKLRN